LLALATVAGLLTFLLLAGMNLTSFRAETVSAPAVERTIERVQAPTPTRTVVTPPEPSPEAPPTNVPSTVVISVSTGGRSWVEVRAGSAAGNQIFGGMLEAGQERVFRELPVWIQLGAPESVSVAVDGTPIVPRSNGSGVTEFVVSERGVAEPVR
jgi:hypothetical protein